MQAKEQGDYLHSGTVPTPRLNFQSKSTLCDHHLGVNATYQPVDLTVPPNKESTSQIARSQQLGVVGAKHTPYESTLQRSSIQINDRNKQANVERAVSNAFSRQAIHKTPSSKPSFIPSSNQSIVENISKARVCCDPCIPNVPSNNNVKEICPPSPFNLEKDCSNKIPQAETDKILISSSSNKISNNIAKSVSFKEISDNSVQEQKCLEEILYKEHPCQQLNEITEKKGR